VAPDQLKLGMLFPPQSNMLEVEIQTDARVAKLVFDTGLAPRGSSGQYGRIHSPAHL
jgi:hypothetical protein